MILVWKSILDSYLLIIFSAYMEFHGVVIVFCELPGGHAVNSLHAIMNVSELDILIRYVN